MADLVAKCHQSVSKDIQDHSTISTSSHPLRSCPLFDYEGQRGVNSSIFKPDLPVLYVPVSNLEDHSKPKADSHSSLPHSNAWVLSAWSNSTARRLWAWRELVNTPAWLSLPGGPASSPRQASSEACAGWPEESSHTLSSSNNTKHWVWAPEIGFTSELPSGELFLPEEKRDWEISQVIHTWLCEYHILSSHCYLQVRKAVSTETKADSDTVEDSKQRL